MPGGGEGEGGGCARCEWGRERGGDRERNDGNRDRWQRDDCLRELGCLLSTPFVVGRPPINILSRFSVWNQAVWRKSGILMLYWEHYFFYLSRISERKMLSPNVESLSCHIIREVVSSNLRPVAESLYEKNEKRAKTSYENAVKPRRPRLPRVGPPTTGLPSGTFTDPFYC